MYDKKNRKSFSSFIYSLVIFIFLKECLKQCKYTKNFYFSLYVKVNQSRETEDELAIILSHEIAHAILGHGVC